MSDTLSITNLGHVLALTQSTFGHVPSQSLVLVGLSDGTTKGHLRVDLSAMVVEHDAAHKLVGWLMADKDNCPESMAVLILDQEGQYSAEELTNLCLNLEISFAMHDVSIVAEHRIVGDAWKAPLQRALEDHPELAVAEARSPKAEAAAWVGRVHGKPSITDKDELLTVAEKIIHLVVVADAPDWQAICDMEKVLDDLLPTAGGDARDVVVELKALIAHAQGRNSFCGDLLTHVTNPTIPVDRMSTGVHRFALHRATSYQEWRRLQGEHDSTDND